MVNNFLLLKDKTILFAEDDIISRTQIIEILKMLFSKVYSAEDGKEAYEIYEDEAPDIVLTDIKMPKKGGLELIKDIRKHDYKTPVVLMTSFTEKDLLVNAANLSIDGYLVKPANLETLTSALCKAIQRSHKEMGLILLSENLFYNLATKELYKNGNLITLGLKEHELLEILINNRHKTVTKKEIEEQLWPIDFVSDSAIKKLILRLRKKIEADIIISVRSIGYRLETRKTPR
jgi:two-component system, OmpR family, response regulator VanR